MSPSDATPVQGRPRLRCRVALHRWARFKHEDADLENPAAQAMWITRCRYCGVERGNGVRFFVGLAVGLIAAAVLLWWLVSPVLAALLVIGALLSLSTVAGVITRSRRIGAFGFRYRD